MIPTITAFAASPDRGQGLARDMRVRWALEEVGQPYEVRLLSFAEMKEAEHLALNPFGQIPTYEEDGLALFETGSIILHIAGQHAGLLPDDAMARARAITWMFAAINTVEPPILELATARLLESDAPWARERAPLIEDRVHQRLKPLHVLQRLKRSGLLAAYANLCSYIARAEARPAYRRAFDAQLAVFAGQPAPR
jgi:glutathione S-transferase